MLINTRGRLSRILAKRVRDCFLAISLLFFFNLVIQAADLRKIYFNSPHSLVVELANQAALVSQSVSESGKLLLVDIDFSRSKLPETLSNDNYIVYLQRQRSASRHFWQSCDQLVMLIESRSQQGLKLSTETLLENLVYQINISPELIAGASVAVPQSLPLEPSQETALTKPLLVMPEPEHKLAVSINDHSAINLFTNQATNSEEFLSKLDPKIRTDLINDNDFKHSNLQKIDSSNLTYIATELASRGLKQEAQAAYQEALKLDNGNLMAHIGLARASDDATEKLTNYLAGIETTALSELGNLWFKQAYDSGDIKAATQALLPLQMAILKNPNSAQFRFDYAAALERLGQDLELAARRYLEAASLAKSSYQQGSRVDEVLLRQSTEALIRVLTIKGDILAAAKYCNSYLTMGYERFLDGKPILIIQRQIQDYKNPFGGSSG